MDHTNREPASNENRPNTAAAVITHHFYGFNFDQGGQEKQTE
jgi:hypothetical protein